jgi:hypothetical protein
MKVEESAQEEFAYCLLGQTYLFPFQVGNILYPPVPPADDLLVLVLIDGPDYADIFLLKTCAMTGYSDEVDMSSLPSIISLTGPTPLG